jgi:hypothetical protein
MFIFLNLTLHSFGPENFVPLVQIRKFQKGLIEENESYEMVGILCVATMQFLLGKSCLRRKPHDPMHQSNIILWTVPKIIFYRRKETTLKT